MIIMMTIIQKSMMIMRDRGLEERGNERIQGRGIGSKTMRVTDKWKVKKETKTNIKLVNDTE